VVKGAAVGAQDAGGAAWQATKDTAASGAVRSATQTPSWQLHAFVCGLLSAWLSASALWAANTEWTICSRPSSKLISGMLYGRFCFLVLSSEPRFIHCTMLAPVMTVRAPIHAATTVGPHQRTSISQDAAGSAANTASEYAAAGKDAAYDAAGVPGSLLSCLCGFRDCGAAVARLGGLGRF